jgi:hypothetical protein
MISSRCSGGAKEKIFLNATVFRGMDSTMTPSKSRMRLPYGEHGTSNTTKVRHVGNSCAILTKGHRDSPPPLAEGALTLVPLPSPAEVE